MRPSSVFIIVMVTIVIIGLVLYLKRNRANDDSGNIGAYSSNADSIEPDELLIQLNVCKGAAKGIKATFDEYWKVAGNWSLYTHLVDWKLEYVPRLKEYYFLKDPLKETNDSLQKQYEWIRSYGYNGSYLEGPLAAGWTWKARPWERYMFHNLVMLKKFKSTLEYERLTRCKTKLAHQTYFVNQVNANKHKVDCVINPLYECAKESLEKIDKLLGFEQAHQL
jgi:hypothetical protein